MRRARLAVSVSPASVATDASASYIAISLHSTAYAMSGEYSGRRFWGRAGVFHNEYRDFIETSEPDAAIERPERSVNRRWASLRCQPRGRMTIVGVRSAVTS